MKRILSCATFMILILSGAQAGDKIKTAEIQTRIYCDHCSQCESCRGRLEKALYEQKGIKRVDIAEKDMRIKVVYNSEKITIEDIRSAVAGSGYDADDVPADPAAAAALDDCCKESE